MGIKFYNENNELGIMYCVERSFRLLQQIEGIKNEIINFPHATLTFVTQNSYNVFKIFFTTICNVSSYTGCY